MKNCEPISSVGAKARWIALALIVLCAGVPVAKGAQGTQWSYGGGGTLYGGASAACDAFVKEMGPGVVKAQMEATAAGDYRCYYKNKSDKDAAVTFGLVYRVEPPPEPEGEDAGSESPKTAGGSGDGSVDGSADAGKEELCEDKHPQMEECYELSGFPYKNYAEARAALQSLNKGKSVNPGSGQPTEATDCKGQHWNMKAGNKLVGTILCCECCQNTKDKPVIEQRCKVSPN